VESLWWKVDSEEVDATHFPLSPFHCPLFFMPIYEYKCRKCGEHFEKRQSISEDPLTVCEKCGGGLEKQWSLSGFQFKGAGWYVTDYSAKKPGESKTSDKESTGAEKSEKPSGGESTEKSDTASNKGETSKKPGPTT